MDSKTKEEVREKIASEIAKTQKEVIEYKEQTKPISPENAIGRISRMDAINNKSVMENALRNSENKLQKLLEIEQKIDDKDFGICIRCGKQIPIMRVLLMPQSRHCVNCAS